MTILVDTDVLIDLALDRQPHAEPAGRLVDLLEGSPGLGFIAWHTLSNFYYLVSPKTGKPEARQFLLELCRFIRVSETGTESLRFAASLEMKDFEDALQVAAAAACGAEAIVTRNLQDYARSPIRALEPVAALDELF